MSATARRDNPFSFLRYCARMLGTEKVFNALVKELNEETEAVLSRESS